MKNLLTNLFFLGLIASPVFAQEEIQTEHPRITESKVDGELEKRIYHFPSNVNFSLCKKGENIKLLEGNSTEADITFLIPGEYVMSYRADNKNGLIDFFEITE